VRVPRRTGKRSRRTQTAVCVVVELQDQSPMSKTLRRGQRREMGNLTKPVLPPTGRPRACSCCFRRRWTMPSKLARRGTDAMWRYRTGLPLGIRLLRARAAIARWNRVDPCRRNFAVAPPPRRTLRCLWLHHLLLPHHRQGPPPARCQGRPGAQRLHLPPSDLAAHRMQLGSV